MQLALGPALIPLVGWAAPEVEAAYVRAEALCRQLGDDVALLSVQYGLATVHEYRGEFHVSQALMEQRLRLLDATDDQALRVESHELLACSLFHQGAFAASLDQTQQALALYDPAQHGAIASLYGKNAGVACHAWAAQSLSLLGDSDQALRRIEAAVRLAEQIGDLYSLASARSQAAFVYQYHQQPELALRWADATIALAEEQGFRYRIATGAILRGWALARLGHHREGIAALRRGLDVYQQTGAQMERPYFLALLADTWIACGKPADGLAAVDEALAMVPNGRAFFYEAELHRLRGTLLLEAGASGRPSPEVRACFQRALDVARRQGAKTLGLRAAQSLAALERRSDDSGTGVT